MSRVSIRTHDRLIAVSRLAVLICCFSGGVAHFTFLRVSLDIVPSMLIRIIESTRASGLSNLV